MMSEQGSFWRRVGSIFTSDAADAVPTGGNGRTTVIEPAEGSGVAAAGRFELTTDSRATPWWRRRQARQVQTREMALRVVELADAMQQYFRQQDERAAEVAGSLDRVGGVLEQLAETQRSQGECLRTIAEHSDAAGKHAANLSETLSRIPESLLTQAEAIRTVATQLDLAQESDTQLMHSLQYLGRAVDTLGSSATAQVEALQGLNTAQRQQHEAFTALVRERSHRSLLVFIATAILAVVTLAALAGTLALHLTG